MHCCLLKLNEEEANNSVHFFRLTFRKSKLSDIKSSKPKNLTKYLLASFSMKCFMGNCSREEYTYFFFATIITLDLTFF